MTKEDQLGALWQKESKDGKKFLAGKFGDQDIVVFKNGYKEEGSNKPDWIIYKSTPKEMRSE